MLRKKCHLTAMALQLSASLSAKSYQFSIEQEQPARWASDFGQRAPVLSLDLVPAGERCDKTAESVSASSSMGA